jgi:hypothetical protein
MAFNDTPNKLEAVFVQRTPQNNYYEQINISASDAIVYLNSQGKIDVDKISTWATNYGIGGGTPFNGRAIFATQSLYATRSIQASYATSSLSASWASSSISSSFVTSASYCLSGSYFNYVNVNIQQLFTTLSLFSSQSVYATSSLYASQSAFAYSASWASSSVSASYTISASYAPFLWLVTSSTYPITSSRAITASFANTASWAPSLWLVTASTYPITSSQAINAINAIHATQSIFTTQSIWATQSVYATQSIYATSSITATSASWASSSISASYAITASWALNFTTTSVTNAASASYASTSSWALNFVTTSVTNATSASYAKTSSWAINLVGGLGTATNATFATQSLYATTSLFATTASFATSSLSSSYPWFVTGSNIAYVGGNVGINKTGPTSRLHIYDVITDADNQTLFVDMYTSTSVGNNNSSLGAIIQNQYFQTASLTVSPFDVGNYYVQAAIVGAKVNNIIQGASQVASVGGLMTQNLIRNGAAVTASFGVLIQPFHCDIYTPPATASNVYGVYLMPTQTNGAILTNRYGIYLAADALGTNKYGFYEALSGLNVFSSSVIGVSGFTGSLKGTASYAQTASWALNFVTTSVTNATSASYANSASGALNFVTASVTSATSASYANTSSWALNFITTSVTNAKSASYANTASWALNFLTTSITNAISASYASTSSWALNLVGGTSTAVQATFATQSLYATSSTYAISASYASSSISTSYAVTASYATMASLLYSSAGNNYIGGFLGIGPGATSANPTFPYLLTFTGSGGVGVLSFDNANIIEARNFAGTYEAFLYPRWIDDVTYMNYGGGGLNIRNSESVSTMFITHNNAVAIGTTSTTARRLELGGININSASVTDFINSPSWIPSGNAAAAAWTVMQIQPNAMNGGYSSSFTGLTGILLQPIHGGTGQAENVIGISTAVRIARLAAAQCTNAYCYTSQINCELAGGAITNSYHLYMNAPTAAGTMVNRYGIYQVGTTEINVFASPVSMSFGLNVTAGGITGSFAGTVSHATSSTYAISASYASSSISTSYAVTASYALNSGGVPTYTSSLFGTASWASNTMNASTADFALIAGNTLFTASYAVTASYALNSGGVPTYTSSLFGTASWASNTMNASTADFALIAGNTLFTASYAVTASYALNVNSQSISASWATTSSISLVTNGLAISNKTNYYVPYWTSSGDLAGSSPIWTNGTFIGINDTNITDTFKIKEFAQYAPSTTATLYTYLDVYPTASNNFTYRGGFIQAEARLNNVNSVTALIGQAQASTTGIVNVLCGLSGISLNVFANVDKLYGGYFKAYNFIGPCNTTSSFGVFIDDSGTTGTTLNKYGIYQSGSADKNYFSGPTQFAQTITGSLSGSSVTSDKYIVGSSGLTYQTTAYTLTSADDGRFVVINASTSTNVVVSSSLSTTFSTTLMQSGSGKIQIVPQTGTNIRNRSSHTGSAGQYAVIRLTRVTSGDFFLFGDTV